MSRASSRLLDLVRHRARLMGSVAAGLILLFLLPGEARLTSRALVAWDATVLLYSGLTLTMMARSDIVTIQDRARLDAGWISPEPSIRTIGISSIFRSRSVPPSRPRTCPSARSACAASCSATPSWLSCSTP